MKAEDLVPWPQNPPRLGNAPSLIWYRCEIKNKSKPRKHGTNVLLRIEGLVWSAQRIPTAVNLDFLDPEQLYFHLSSLSVILKRLGGPRSRLIISKKFW
jgi:hypothetical protein